MEANLSLMFTSGTIMRPLFLTAEIYFLFFLYTFPFFPSQNDICLLGPSIPDPCMHITCHVWHLAVGDRRVSTWWCWCTYTDADSLLCLPNSTGAHRLSSIERLLLLPSLSCLVKGWATTTQLHIHFTHTATQPASQVPLPLTLPISSLLFTARNPPLYLYSAFPHRPSPSLPDTTQISTPPYVYPPPPPIFTPRLHRPTHHQRWVQKEMHKGEQSGEGARVGRWRPKGWRWEEWEERYREKTAWNGVKCEGGQSKSRVGGRRGFLDGESKGWVERLANDILIRLSLGQISGSMWEEESHSLQMSKNTWPR